MKLNLSLIQRMGALAVASALMAQASVTQAGDPLLQLLEVLRSRGNITETEYKELRESAETQESMQFKSLEQRLLEESGKVRQLNDDVTSQKAMTQKLSESFDAAVGDSVDKKLDGKWFNNLKLSGYTQLRYTSMLDNDGAVLNVPNDGSAAEQESFRLRRGRIKFSGDVAPRLYLYAQMDLAASAGRNGSFALQMRDLYGDLALTEDK
ncbi:MAG: hypothetical protein ACKVHO_07310, partial [Verrucomicrobiia bacterium]